MRIAPIASAALFLSVSMVAQEGGIETFAAETLFEEGMRASFAQIYKRKATTYQGSNEVPDALDRRFEENRSVLSFDYGLRPDFTLTALLPFVHKELRSTIGRTQSSGVGDAAVLGKYRINHGLWTQGGYAWTVVGGLEAPTGRTDSETGGTRLPVGMQAGRGAWNPFLSTAGIYEAGRARFDGSLFYKLNTEGSQDFHKGDFMSVDLSAAYRFLHYKYPGPTFGAKVGLQWRHEEKDQKSGQTVFNSGGDQLFLKTGLSIHPIPRMDMVLAAAFPLYTDVNGTQLVRDLVLSFNFGVRF